jgi:hypothetical protein
MLMLFVGLSNAYSEPSDEEIAEWRAVMSNCELIREQYVVCSNQLATQPVEKKHWIGHGLSLVLIVLLIIF